MTARIAACMMPALLAAAPAFALAGGHVDCAKTVIQPEMNECAAIRFEKADAELNRVYKKTMAGIGAPDQGLLRDTQRRWIAFRDSECLYEAGGTDAIGLGASMGPMVYSGCEETLTRQRIRQLQTPRG